MEPRCPTQHQTADYSSLVKALFLGGLEKDSLQLMLAMDSVVEHGVRGAGTSLLWAESLSKMGSSGNRFETVLCAGCLLEINTHTKERKRDRRRDWVVGAT